MFSDTMGDLIHQLANWRNLSLGETSSSETSVPLYQNTPLYIPEYSNLYNRNNQNTHSLMLYMYIYVLY
jgi:hypothetical protein